MIAQSEKLEWVDTVRGTAICLVFIYHWYIKIGHPFDPDGFFGWLFLTGNYGVQLFFIASAYTLMLSADREMKKGRGISWKKFYIRRFFRIAPAYYVAAIFYPLWSSYLWRDTYYSGFDYVKVLAFVNGFFVDTQNRLVPGSWSISAEYFFYILFPLILFLCRGIKTTTLFFLVMFPISVLGTKFVETYYHLDSLSGSYAYYHPLRWTPVFLLGVVTYKWLVPLARSRNVSPLALGAAAAAMLVFNFVFQDNFKLEYFWVSFAWCLLIISLAIGPPLRGTKAMQFIGRLSFAGYLVHFWALDLSIRLGESIFTAEQEIQFQAFVFLLASFITVVLSYIVNILVEQPGQRLGHYIARRWGMTRQPSHSEL